MSKRRVMVFIDGQNLYKALQKRFRTRLHPRLLAEALVGDDRDLVGTFYYSGIHDRDENLTMYHTVRRRHDLMRRTGVAVTERTLRYHWEWRVDDDITPPWYDSAPDRTKAWVRRHRGAREKGIDVALALDAVAAILTDECDTVIIVSRDRDLMEVASEVQSRCRRSDDYRVEVAYVAERRDDMHFLTDYDRFVEIDETIVSQARDDFDYTRGLDPDRVDAFLAQFG